MEPANRSRTLTLISAHVREDALSDRTDDELMLLTRGGMRAAFDVLVRRHQVRALRLAARYVGDRAAAKDIAQSALLEIYRSRDRYQPHGKFTGYLCRVVLNQCRMFVRSARVREQAAPNVDSSNMPMQELLAHEHHRDLERALSSLSEKLRAVVILRHGEDLNLLEIAEVLELPIGTVKRRLFDAMAQLRKTMEGAT